MKKSILFLVLLSILIGVNLYSIYHGFNYDALDIIVQSLLAFSFISSFIFVKQQERKKES